MKKLLNISLFSLVWLCSLSAWTQTVSTFAGTGVSGYSGDNGFAQNAEISEPYGIVTDSDGNVFFSDPQNNAIRRIDKDTQIISTVVDADHQGGVILVNDLAIDNDVIYFIDPDGASYNILKFALDDYVVSLVGQVSTNYAGVCVLGDSIFFTNSGQHTIELFTMSTGTLTHYCGVVGSSGNSDGGFTNAKFNVPFGIAADLDGNLLVGDFAGGAVRKINLSTQTVSTLATGLSGVEGVTVASNGDIYIAENTGNRISKIDNSGTLSIVAGTGTAGFMDGDGNTAMFNSPVKVAIDDENNIYVSDNDNFRIRHIGCNSALPPVLITSTGNLSFCTTNTEEWYVYTQPGLSILNENEYWVWYTGNCGEEELFIGDTLVVKPTETTSYYVRGEGGCFQNGICEEIVLTEIDCDSTVVEGVNAFSPNNDGVNDVWIIPGIEPYFENKVYIYNRWGDLISEIVNYNNLDNTWGGLNSFNVLVSPGTYYYIVEDSNKNKLRSGWVQVIR